MRIVFQISLIIPGIFFLLLAAVLSALVADIPILKVYEGGVIVAPIF